ncbi:MAG: hypothetical protein ACI38Z_04610 [Parafannyhessea sp.]|uniref:hypothetical protein n=1 Tax=Parafannyhessea sp. TaxID=2847324 RepID=UPI003F06523B
MSRDMDAAIVAQGAPRQLTMADTINFAKSVAGGSLLPRDYQRNPANVIIAVNLGQSMGLSPAESLYRINVIQGKPTASAELIAAQVRKAGHKLRISKDEARQSVTATIVRCDDPDYPISETRDAAWAQRMGLASKDNYRKQPMTMLTWRAITAVAREACPEALYGVAYTPDEMRDMDPQPAQEATSGHQPAQGGQADLGAVRVAYAAYRRATGATNAQAMADVCAAVGAADMRSMTQAQADQAEAWLRSHAAAGQAQEPDEAALADDGRVGTQPAEPEPEAEAEAEQEPVEPDLYGEELEF